VNQGSIHKKKVLCKLVKFAISYSKTILNIEENRFSLTVLLTNFQSVLYGDRNLAVKTHIQYSLFVIIVGTLSRKAINITW